jgi:AraC-like DNA-binding protein
MAATAREGCTMTKQEQALVEQVIEDVRSQMLMVQGFYFIQKDMEHKDPRDKIYYTGGQKAAEWLRIHPGSTVSEIAYQLGFNTARYFSLCFKDHYGISPNEYRKKISGNSL